MWEWKRIKLFRHRREGLDNESLQKRPKTRIRSKISYDNFIDNTFPKVEVAFTLPSISNFQVKYSIIIFVNFRKSNNNRFGSIDKSKNTQESLWETNQPFKLFKNGKLKNKWISSWKFTKISKKIFQKLKTQRENKGATLSIGNPTKFISQYEPKKEWNSKSVKKNQDHSSGADLIKDF